MGGYYEGDINTDTNIGQFENQGLIVRNSHAVDVTQTEVQGLLLIQAALQAAVEAAVSVLSENNKNVMELQRISQSLDVSQMQTQTVIIEDSGEVVVTQTEVQVDVVVQAAINLLAKLTLDLG